MEYKVGQILTLQKDVEVERCLGGEKMVIPKGNKIIIGQDKLAHHIKTEMVQPLGDDAEVKGYDADGLAEYIFMDLKSFFPIREWMEGYEIKEKEIINEIKYALEEIGFE